MKKLLISALALLVGVGAAYMGVGATITATMPPYRDQVGDDNYIEKITGLYLVEQSAARQDNLIIYGSSELRTQNIPTHPVNFFAGKRAGFQVNLVGRGSCQSLIHAISIAATGDALTGKKVVLITSPQSYVREGIAPDLFYANFSPQQYLELLAAPDLTEELKVDISSRVAVLLDRYEAMPDSIRTDPAIRYLADYRSEPSVSGAVCNGALSPYYAARRRLYGWKDLVLSRRVIESVDSVSAAPKLGEINWVEEERAAIGAAQRMTDNNEFGMLNDYYNTYIGARLARQQNRDRDLSYTISEEYEDLRILFEVCRQKGIEPLFVHVPLHGEWGDYTGFTADRRGEYYENVRRIAGEYDVEILDLTGYEYEDYFLCDVMHLGWKGWLEVDRALIDYYYRD